jgi:hypothetical protein
MLVPVVALLVALNSPHVAAQTWTCPAGGSIAITYPNGVATIVCVPPTPPPQPVNCAGAWSAWTPVPPGTWSACTSGTQTRQESRAFTVTTPPANGGTACPASPETRTVSQACTTTPPPTVPNTVTITNATAHDTNGQKALQWTTSGGSPVTITVEVDGQPATAVSVAPTLRSLTLLPQPTVTTLYKVTFNKKPATGTWIHTESFRHVTVVVSAPPPVDPPPVDPPPATGQIWGTVTAAELGECSAAAHDKYLVDGGDGWRYRVWHPQNDPSGCIYGHEHGDDPARQQNAFVRANFDGRMGYAARRDSTMPGEPNGHMEPHNGYKIHVVNIGDMNEEGRTNRNATTSMPHMGTGGPARFSVSRHSVSIADFHENGIHHTAVHAMFETGTTGNSVCEPRVNAPTKDGLIVNSASGCKMDSPYEIWGMVVKILRQNGTDVLWKFVTPAVFDPITVHNKANPSELVFAWDPRVAQYKSFPNDWSGHRGCAREGYSQVGYHFNGNDPSENYLLDVRTNRVVDVASAFTTRLVVGRSNSGGGSGVPFSSNILQYKQRRDHCDFRSKLSLTN